MSAFHTHHTALVAGAIAVLLLGGCSAGGTEPDPAGGTTPPAATVESTVVAGADDAATETPTEPATDAPGERPEGLDASLPVPPGTLVTATPDGSEWEYMYADVTSDEARAFAEEIKGMGFDVKVTADSDGVEQWYMQSADWAIKLEETHADESLMYWVDAIIE